MQTAAGRRHARVLGQSAGCDRIRDRWCRKVREILRALSQLRAAARPPAGHGGSAVAAEEPGGKADILPGAMGHVEMAVAVPTVFLAHDHGTARTRSCVLSVR